MSIYKTRGIVLKTNKLGESDRIITLITNMHGKVRAVAKGVRKTKSKFGSRLEPFTNVDLVLYEGRNLDTITQAEIVVSFSDIREDLDALSHGIAMLDLAEKMSAEGERDTALYNLLLRSLEVLSESKTNMRLLLAAFDIKLMAISGYMPKIDRCVLCEAKTSANYRFSFEWGGLTCKSCSIMDRSGIAISKDLINLLNRILKTPLADIVYDKIDPALERELNILIRDYVSYYVQTRLKSRECLGRLINIS